ncbi:hypothetical protein AOQ71_22955 [Bradyrhizobium manausense]|uniref:Uncharacterized protein n=1 Tax=Bradyrhizobium manausense TaxID=989370 RepID=A0A0R3DE83_9BRAD|nr:hypothetical protein AOQ71_22955 [Bradyrhizobium manausense]
MAIQAIWRMIIGFAAAYALAAVRLWMSTAGSFVTGPIQAADRFSGLPSRGRALTAVNLACAKL